MKNLFLSRVAEVQLVYKTKVKATDRAKITCSKDAVDILENLWESMEHYESMYLIMLNRANRVLGVTNLSKGGISGCICDTRIVFQYALKANASGLILSHSHPSGNIQPSEADKQITRKIKQAGEILDIKLLDHIIVTAYDGHFSFADEGLM